MLDLPEGGVVGPAGLPIRPSTVQSSTAMGTIIEFGRVRAELRASGRPIPMFDILIAAIARANGLTVVTADAHFNAVAGLGVKDWLSAWECGPETVSGPETVLRTFSPPVFTTLLR